MADGTAATGVASEVSRGCDKPNSIAFDSMFRAVTGFGL